MNSIVLNFKEQAIDKFNLEVGIFKGEDFKFQEIPMVFDDEDKDYLYDKTSLLALIKDNNPFQIIVSSHENVVQRVLYHIDEFWDVLATQGLHLWYKYQVVFNKTLYDYITKMELQDRLAFLGYFHVNPMFSILFTQKVNSVALDFEIYLRLMSIYHSEIFLIFNWNSTKNGELNDFKTMIWKSYITSPSDLSRVD